MTLPLVTIACITFNHEPYIGEAIEGFLLQKTNFAVEIIIHDDCSTDKTREIIQKYHDQYPDRINLILQSVNQFSLGHRILLTHVIPKCNGKYVALCEGDDYWTDPYKLQKQVDFLEQNTDFSICYHDVSVLRNGIHSDSHVRIYDKDYMTITDLAEGNFIHTPSCVFRNKLFDALPDVLKSSPVGDYVLHMLNAQYGKIKRLPEKMAVYRRHAGGMWTGREAVNKQKSWLDVLSALMLYFEDSPEVLEKLKEQRLNTFRRLVSLSMKGSKDALLAIFQRAESQEYSFITDCIMDVNQGVINTKKNVNNMEYLNSQIALKDVFKLILMKAKYRFVR